MPALGGQVQATPGDVVQTWFKADEVGTYSGHSTIFSGTSFPAMRTSVRVVTVPEYTAYVEQLQKDLTAAQGIIADAQKEAGRPGRAGGGGPVTPPPTTATRPEIVTRDVRRPRQSWIERATSADHKTVGLLFIATSLTLLAFAATEFALMRLQLIVPENSLIQPEIFSRLMSASVVTFVVLACLPLALGLISFIVPLQIGARGVALPRLHQFSYWLYAAGALTVYGSFLYSAPESGSMGLPPLSDLVFTPQQRHRRVDRRHRPGLPGLRLLGDQHDRHPAPDARARPGLAPGAAVRVGRGRDQQRPAGDRPDHARGAHDAVHRPPLRRDLLRLGLGRGAGALRAPRLHLLHRRLRDRGRRGRRRDLGDPPTFARKPIFSRRAAAASMVAIAVLGLLAWMQNMYIAPLNEGWTIMAMAFALALAVPVGTLFYVWVATIWGGALDLRAATWYALLAISTMAFGLVAEFAYSVIPVGWALDYTTASQGDTLYVLVGGGVFGGFAALHYWFPKLSGRLLGEGAGKLALVLMVIGIHLYVIPMFFAGLLGQSVDVFKFYEDTGLDGYNLVASIGAFILVIGLFVELGNAAYSWHNGLPARGPDPWGGTTLEWYALSPPPPHNFDAVPDVRGPEPLHDIRESILRRQESFEAPAPLERVAGPASEPAPEPEAQRGAGGRIGLRRRGYRPGSLKSMSAVAASGDAVELARFRRLVTVTIVAAFALILIGGIVRVSDSGLGCGAAGSGTHGWPLCEGGVLPADSAKSVVEFTHRLAATVVTVLIALVAWRAFRRLRPHRLLVRGSLVAIGLVLAQAALGGLTVEHGLEDELVAAHLGAAMLLLGLLFVLRRGAEQTAPPRARRCAGCGPWRS